MSQFRIVPEIGIFHNKIWRLQKRQQGMFGNGRWTPVGIFYSEDEAKAAAEHLAKTPLKGDKDA